MPKPDPKRNEELRRLVLEVLAARAAIALKASAICSYLEDEFGCIATEEEAARAAQFWAEASPGVSLPLTREIYRKGGSTPHYQITAAGQLTVERQDF